LAPGSIAAAALSSFLGSLVECVEALTVVLAIGSVRGWRSVLAGAAAAVLVLAGIVAAFGPMLGVLEWPPLRLGVGSLLLLFGLRWLRKAILRAAGVVARHDETREFAETTARMRAAGSPPSARWDGTAATASFNIVMLEGIEVVFIVTAVGTRQDPAGPALIEPAIIGAGSAAILVIGLGLLLHRPIARLPENALKFAVSVLLSSFGVLWIGEALGLAWPGGDLALLVLAAGLGLWALVLVRLCRLAAARAAARRGVRVLVGGTGPGTDPGTAPARDGPQVSARHAPAATAPTSHGPQAPERHALAAAESAAPAQRPRSAAAGTPLASALRRCLALFVDDRWLGIGVVVWIAFTALVLGRLPHPAGALALWMPWRCTLFVLGPALLLGYRAVRTAAMVLIKE